MAVMVLILNAVLYVVALSLSLAVLTPVPEGASRRVRTARRLLVVGGGLAMSAAMTLSFMGRWYASGIAGCVAIVIVSACLWLGLTSRFSPRGEDDDDGQDGGGGTPDDAAFPPQGTGKIAELDDRRGFWEPARHDVTERCATTGAEPVGRPAPLATGGAREGERAHRAPPSARCGGVGPNDHTPRR